MSFAAGCPTTSSDVPLIAPKRAAKAIVRQGSGAHSRASHNEKGVAVRLGGTVTPRSGAGTKKGDVQVKGLARIECKGTTKASFSITKAMLAKNDLAALSAGEYPIFVVQFLDVNGDVEDEQAVMRLTDLQELLRRANGQ